MSYHFSGEADANKGKETMELFPQNSGFGSEAAAVKETPDARYSTQSLFELLQLSVHTVPLAVVT
jgi:hypothetical protein